MVRPVRLTVQPTVRLFPVLPSKDKKFRKYSENWQAENELKNEAVSKLKREILQGELKEERRMYTNTFRLYRFVVDPKKRSFGN